MLYVLVLSADAALAEGVRVALAGHGFRIDLASSIPAAYGLLEPAHHVAVLVDHDLPGVSTDDIFGTLARRLPRAATILMTANSGTKDAVELIRLGVSEYVLKPIDHDELRVRLGRIADRWLAEEILRRQSSMLRSVLENIRDAVLVVDRLGKVILFNSSVERIIGPVRMGALPEEWPQHGRAYLPDGVTLAPPSTLPLTRALQGEIVVDAEVYFRPAGSLEGYWTSASASPLRDDEGIKGAVAIFRDINERKLAQESLRRAEQRFRVLVQRSSDIITVLAGDGTILYQSPSIETVLGYRPEDRIGKSVFNDPYVHPDDIGKKDAFFHDTRRQQGLVVTSEYRIRHADGTYRQVEAIGQNLLDDARINAIVTNYRDVSERKAALDELRRERSRRQPDRERARDRAVARLGRPDYPLQPLHGRAHGVRAQ